MNTRHAIALATALVLMTLATALGPQRASAAPSLSTAKDQPTDGDLVLTVPKAQVDKCEAEGGCKLITLGELNELVNNVLQEGIKRGSTLCPGQKQI